MRKYIYGILICVSLLSSSLIGNAQNIQNEAEKFGRLLRLIDTYYVDTTNVSKLTETAIVNVLQKLDPHSVYISLEDVKKMNEPLQGSFDGIGISFNILNDTLMVLQTIPGGPSEKVGLQAGDRIIYVDDKLIAGIGITNQDVLDKLKGLKGTLVKVKIKRNFASELIDYDIIRDKIPIHSLDAAYMIDKKTGYIKLNRFSATSTQETVDAIIKLKIQYKAENIIFDLRGNGGGYLNSAFEIADQFLNSGKMIVYTEGTKSPRKDYKSTTDGNFEFGKLAVLIDEGSASASEIVAGAIQDWDRGVVIGLRSFGKGLVQQPFYLTDGSQVRLTTAHYYTPSGRCIQKPYSEGVNDYYKDNLSRYEDGELFNKDSIKVNDSLVYKTLINKRNVYGGGGVIPDIFVPMDTSSNYKYYNTLIRKNILYPFVTNYFDRNREKLKAEYPTFLMYKAKFNITDNILEELYTKGEKEGIERDAESIKFMHDKICLQIKSIIARNLWSSSEYFEIMNQKDETVNKAMEYINDQVKYNSILLGTLK